jgi:hypothetical protein
VAKPKQSNGKARRRMKERKKEAQAANKEDKKWKKNGSVDL